MKRYAMIVLLLSLSNLSLYGSLTERLATADKKITALKKDIKSGVSTFVCQTAWCEHCLCRSTK